MARITLQRIAIAGLILLSSWPHSVVGREYPHPLFQSHSTAIEFALALPYEYENKCRLLTYSDRQKEFEKRNENVHAYGYLDEVKKTYEEAKRSFEWSGKKVGSAKYCKFLKTWVYLQWVQAKIERTQYLSLRSSSSV